MAVSRTATFYIVCLKQISVPLLKIFRQGFVVRYQLNIGASDKNDNPSELYIS